MAGYTLPAGAMVALATPVTAKGEPDPAALERLVEHVVTGGVRAVCPVGSTGEGARLSRAQRIGVTLTVRGLVPPDLPVIAGVPASSLPEAHMEMRELATARATAALVAPPSYFPAADAEVARLYWELAEQAPLPLVLYNIPQFTKTRIAPAVVGELARHPNVVGIKDSSRDMEYLHQVVYAVEGAPDFRILTGTDTLLVASLVAGAHGTIAASANLCPDLSSAICAAVEAGDLTGALQLQRRLTQVVLACRRGDPPAGWKAALEARGLCAADLVPPARHLDEPGREAVVSELTSLGILGSRHVSA